MGWSAFPVIDSDSPQDFAPLKELYEASLERYAAAANAAPSAWGGDAYSNTPVLPLASGVPTGDGPYVLPGGMLPVYGRLWDALTDPPDTSGFGTVYNGWYGPWAVLPGATGDWAGHANTLAEYNPFLQEWRFAAPVVPEDTRVFTSGYTASGPFVVWHNDQWYTEGGPYEWGVQARGAAWAAYGSTTLDSYVGCIAKQSGGVWAFGGGELLEGTAYLTEPWGDSYSHAFIVAGGLRFQGCTGVQGGFWGIPETIGTRIQQVPMNRYLPASAHYSGTPWGMPADPSYILQGAGNTVDIARRYMADSAGDPSGTYDFPWSHTVISLLSGIGVPFPSHVAVDKIGGGRPATSDDGFSIGYISDGFLWVDDNTSTVYRWERVENSEKVSGYSCTREGLPGEWVYVRVLPAGTKVAASRSRIDDMYGWANTERVYESSGDGLQECDGVYGFTRKYTREIEYTTDPGEAGQEARFTGHGNVASPPEIIRGLLSEPPALPEGYWNTGDLFAVAADATGDWAGCGGMLATMNEMGEWVFTPTAAGVQYATAQNRTIQATGTGWAVVDGSAYQHNGSTWVRKDDQSVPADVVTTGGMEIQQGDLIGPWLYNERQAVIDRLQTTAAQTTGWSGYIPSPDPFGYPGGRLGGRGGPDFSAGDAPRVDHEEDLAQALSEYAASWSDGYTPPWMQDGEAPYAFAVSGLGWKLADSWMLSSWCYIESNSRYAHAPIMQDEIEGRELMHPITEWYVVGVGQYRWFNREVDDEGRDWCPFNSGLQLGTLTKWLQVPSTMRSDDGYTVVSPYPITIMPNTLPGVSSSDIGPPGWGSDLPLSIEESHGCDIARYGLVVCRYGGVFRYVGDS